MNISLKKHSLAFIFVIVFCQNLQANEAAPKSLDGLLEKIKQDYQSDLSANKKREADFLKDQTSQKKKLADAKAELIKEQQIEKKLKKQFDTNEKELTKLEEKLKLTVGTLGELFGIVRQVAGDSKGQFENSIVTAQFPERMDFISNLASRKELPNSKDLENLWFNLLKEMVESGKVTKFERDVVELEGLKSKKEVFRVGSFNLLSEGKYLRYDNASDEVYELGRQPHSHFLSYVEDFTYSDEKEVLPLAVDPSRGAILSALVQAPSLLERFKQGGLVGYVILLVLLSGLFVTLKKVIYLTNLEKQIRTQLLNKQIDPNNPLGSIFATFEKFRDKSLENLEIALEEAIFKSTKQIEKGLKTIKVLAAVAPLLGLLGTVTGMISTFQSMMLFGSGDPKVMAGGISQALVTTVLGLVAAIPLILLHSYASSKSRDVTEIIEEQSIGLIAQRTEKA